MKHVVISRLKQRS